MARYFFDVQDGTDLVDKEGVEIASLIDAKREAVRLSGALLFENASRFCREGDWAIELRDEAGAILFALTIHALDPASSNLLRPNRDL